MSLHHIAKHLQEQGRGPDDMLVHMTSGEVGALQQLAKAHGGSLTVNPHTGLPEAGFLSTLLPVAAGALAVATGQYEFLPYIAAGVGAADYALTGSLQQGLMAGLGTWSGGELTAGLGAAGAAGMAEEGGNQAAEEFAKTQAETAANPAYYESATPYGAGNASTQIANNAALDASQKAAFQTALDNGGNAADIVRGSGAAAVNPTAAQGLAAGVASPSAWGNTIMNNKMAALGVAAPLLMGNNLLGKQNSVQGLPQQKNPFGMKEIPRDANGNPIFTGQFPDQPNPPYQAHYSNYQSSPYVNAADGGLMQDKLNFAAGGDMFPGSQIDKTQYATSPQMPA